MYMRKECDHSFLDLKLTHREGGKLEAFIVFKKFIYHVFVLVGEHGAGGIDERAADF